MYFKSAMKIKSTNQYGKLNNKTFALFTFISDNIYFEINNENIELKTN